VDINLVIRLENKRRDLRLSAKAFSGMLGIDPGVYSKLVNPQSKIILGVPRSSIPKVAKILDISQAEVERLDLLLREGKRLGAGFGRTFSHLAKGLEKCSCRVYAWDRLPTTDSEGVLNGDRIIDFDIQFVDEVLALKMASLKYPDAKFLIVSWNGVIVYDGSQEQPWTRCY